MTTKMDFTKMTIDNFINNLIKYNNIDEILNTCETQGNKGNIFDIINRKSQINLDNFPTIKKHRDAIKRLPNVIKYYNNNSD